MTLQRQLALLLAVSGALAACADEAARREYLYKPAYCLAGGLANIGKEECLPQTLKDKAEAVATAKQEAAAPATATPAATAAAPAPVADASVYYTDDQRLMMSYAIARAFFPPNAKLTQSSATTSLEVAGLIPAPPVPTACGANKARRDVINFVRDHVAEAAITRDTAEFLAKNYTDQQLTEMYRVVRAEGSLDDVRDDVFIMPDPKRKGHNINVKPKGGAALGGILSYTTSRVTSRVVSEQRGAIEATLKERTGVRKAEAATTDAACAEPKPVEPTSVTAAPAVVTPAPAPAPAETPKE